MTVLRKPNLESAFLLLTVLALATVAANGLFGGRHDGVSRAADKLANFLRVRPVSGGSISLSPTVSPSPTPKPAEDAVGAADSTADRPATTYTVKDGDTYGCIAERYYGSFEHYVDIMAVNPTDQLGFSEYGLFVDAVLNLPAIPAASLKPASHLCQ